MEAVRAIVADGEAPTPERVAERAGVSERTLFRLFGDLPGLWEAVRVRMAADLIRLLQPEPFEGDLRRRARELVRRRLRAFEAMAPYRRWVDVREVHYPAIRQGREALDRVLRAQAAEALAAEISANEPLGPVVDCLLSYESWSYLRTSRGLAQRSVANILETALLRLVAASGPRSPVRDAARGKAVRRPARCAAPATRAPRRPALR